MILTGMVLPGLETALASVGQALLSEAGKSSVAAAGRRLGRRPGRADRRVAYQRYAVRLLRARLRIGSLLGVYAARLNPLDAVAVLTGFPAAVSALDRVITDLADVVEAWHAVRAVAPAAVSQAADEVLTALSELLVHIDPGWRRPRRRRMVQRHAYGAEQHFQAALTEFSRVSEVDAALRRRERRAARQRAA